MLPQGVSEEGVNKAKTILVVDDDAVVLKALHSILGLHGYRVLLAQTSDEAIAHVQRHPDSLDLLVIDAVMPKMSGPELADILVFLRPDMKVLFVTGLDSLAIRLAFDHPCDCVQKPFTARSLVAKVQETLGEANVTAAVDS